MRNKYLVTGGAGFIGSNLVDELVRWGNRVVCVDNESTEGNGDFFWNNKASNYLVDICDYHELDAIVKREKPEVIFHMAAESSIQPTLDRPQEACQINFLGTCNVLQAARNNGVNRVVYSSTSAAYGIKNKPPLTEDMPRDCLNPYSVSKVAAEDLCKMYYSLWGLETIILRYFNVYGERQPTRGKYAPVMGVFRKQKSEGNKMTVTGDGLQTRDYIHVSDVIKSNINASLVMGSEAMGEIVNVGTGESYSVLDLVDLIGGEHEHIPKRSGEAMHSLANITKLKQLLNCEPKIKLSEWIKQNEHLSF